MNAWCEGKGTNNALLSNRIKNSIAKLNSHETSCWSQTVEERGEEHSQESYNPKSCFQLLYLSRHRFSCRDNFQYPFCCIRRGKYFIRPSKQRLQPYDVHNGKEGYSLGLTFFSFDSKCWIKAPEAIFLLYGPFLASLLRLVGYNLSTSGYWEQKSGGDEKKENRKQNVDGWKWFRIGRQRGECCSI